jgi:hypothetical protein
MFKLNFILRIVEVLVRPFQRIKTCKSSCCECDTNCEDNNSPAETPTQNKTILL